MTKPDFSGTWVFDPGRSRLEIAAPDATTFVVEHREPMLRISRTHVAGDRSDTFSLDLTTDGREVVVDRDGLSMHARAFWNGDILVFETRLVGAGEEGTNVVRYKLAQDRNSFVAEERFRSRQLNYDNRWFMGRAVRE
jgi:hypothetical protein